MITRERLLAAIKTTTLYIRSCGMCGYPLSYHFVDDQFGFNSGCDCLYRGWAPRDESELDFYLNETSWQERLEQFVAEAEKLAAKEPVQG